MKWFLLPLLMMSGFASADPSYEPFPYEPGLLPGVGQWTGEEGQGSLAVMPGSLKYEGLALSQKNRVKLPATRSKVHEAKCPLGVSLPSPWFSFILRLDSTEGFAVAKEGSVPSPFGILRLASGNTNGPGVYLKPGAGGAADSFQVLISKRSNPNKVTPSGEALKVGVPHLVVGHYDTSTSPHSLRLWIDPAADFLGKDEAPQPSLTTNDGNDLAASPSDVILGGGVGSPGIMIDEIRVGGSWAEVTPIN